MTQPCLVVFDLDRTLTRYDSYLPYLLGFLLATPSRVVRLWSLPLTVLSYVLKRIDNTQLKQRFLASFLEGTDRVAVQRWTDRFLEQFLASGLRREALRVLDDHRQRGDVLVLLTASLDLYVRDLGTRLGFEHVICTLTAWQGDRLTGLLAGPNRYGAEKVRCLKELKASYPEHRVVVYADHHSDIPLLLEADQGILVNGSSKARRLAAQAGLQQVIWSA
jgi:HAD superfamily hydrolase (TIGR01490 family)